FHITMKRLFDIVENNAQHEPHKVLFGYKDNNEWKKILYKDALVKVQNLAASLLDILGLPSEYSAEAMHKIGIISANRPEWLLTDMAVQEASCILTPIYITVGLPDLEYIINESDIKIFFISNSDIYNRYKPVFDK